MQDKRMLPIRLSSFIFMLMFTLLEARDSKFKHHPLYQGILEEKIATNEFIEAKGIRQSIVVKEIMSIISISPEEESKKTRLNGRKLASKGSLKKEKANTKAKEIAKMMPMDGRSSNSKISGATPSPCNNKGKKRRKMDVICNQSVRRSIPKKKAKFPDGFVALSADYHFPNSHPPRHN